jgi:hypothetical protein
MIVSGQRTWDTFAEPGPHQTPWRHCCLEEGKSRHLPSWAFGLIGFYSLGLGLLGVEWEKNEASSHGRICVILHWVSWVNTLVNPRAFEKQYFLQRMGTRKGQRSPKTKVACCMRLFWLLSFSKSLGYKKIPESQYLKFLTDTYSSIVFILWVHIANFRIQCLRKDLPHAEFGGDGRGWRQGPRSSVFILTLR